MKLEDIVILDNEELSEYAVQCSKECSSLAKDMEESIPDLAVILEYVSVMIMALTIKLMQSDNDNS